MDHNKLWKILQEMGIPDHLTCLLRNLYAGQEATVRILHGTRDWFQIGKEIHQGCILLLSRQEYWSGLLFPSPGNLPDPGIEPGSPALQAVFTI